MTRALEDEATEAVTTAVQSGAALELYEQLAGKSGSLSAVSDASDAVSSSPDAAAALAPLADLPLPLLAAGAAGAGAVFLAARALGGASSGAVVKSMSATNAYDILSEGTVPRCFVDVRAVADVRERGKPKVPRGCRFSSSEPLFTTDKKTGDTSRNDSFAEDVLSLAARAARSDSEADEVVVVLLDSYGSGTSRDAAAALAREFKSQKASAAKAAGKESSAQGTIKVVAVAAASIPKLTIVTVSGGFEGQSGWIESGLPWDEPRPDIITALLGSVSKASETLKERPTLVGGLLAVGGIAAATTFAFAEVETAVELIGGVTILNYALKNFLFAEDRKRAIQNVKSTLDDVSGKSGSVATVNVSPIEDPPAETKAAPAEEGEPDAANAEGDGDASPAADSGLVSAAEGQGFAAGGEDGVQDGAPQKQEAKEWIANWKARSSVTQSVEA